MMFKSYLNISVNTIKSSNKSITNAIDESGPNLDIYSTLLSYVEINDIDDIIPSFSLSQSLNFVHHFFDSKLRLLNSKCQIAYMDMQRHLVYFLEQEGGYIDEVYRFGEMMLKAQVFCLAVGIKTSNKLFDYSEFQIDPHVDERLPYGVMINFIKLMDYIQKPNNEKLSNIISISTKELFTTESCVDYKIWKSGLQELFEVNLDVELPYTNAIYRFCEGDLILIDEHKAIINKLFENKLDLYESCLEYISPEPLNQINIIEYIYKTFGINTEKHLKKTFETPTIDDYIFYLKNFKQNIRILIPVSTFVKESLIQIIKYQKIIFDFASNIFDIYQTKGKSVLTFVQLKEFFTDCDVELLKGKKFLKNLKKRLISDSPEQNAMIDKSLFYDLYWVFDLHKQKDVRSRNYESQYKICKRVRNKKKTGDAKNISSLK